MASLPRVGDRVIGIKSLRFGIEQMYRPAISVPMLGIRQKIAIGGSRIDASQHRRGTLEDFVMQADTNCRQILGSIDRTRLPGCGLKPAVDRADADGDVKQIAQQLSNPSVRTGAAGPRLSMTAHRAAAEGGREAIIDNAARAPNSPP